MAIDPSAYIHPTAIVTGNVTLGARVSVWPTAVLRGDSAAITIGDDSNVQDGTIVHVDDGLPTVIGERVAIGHRAIVHGSIVGAGAVCREGMEIPPNSLVLGVPGKVVRETTPEDHARIRHTVDSYLELQTRYRSG